MKLETDIIIFYDGDCNACSRFVSILLKHKNKKTFKLTSLQSRTAKILNLDQSIDSIVYKEGNRYFYFSEAIFKTAEHLQGPIKLICIFKFLPKRLLIFFYKAFAKRRKLFFKKNQCILISDKDKTLFLP